MDVVAVEIHPLEKIRMDGEKVARLATDHSVDPFAEDFVMGAATRVVTALNRVDHDRATFFARQAALSRFDPQLGQAFLSRSRDEAVRARLQMGEALLAAERKFLAAQSASLYEGVYDGVYGDQMREIIAAEYRLLEDRRDLARTQNLGTALAIVAMAGAIYVGNNTDSGNFFESRTMGNILALSSVWAMSSAFSAHAQSKIIGENFLVQMAPAIDRQVTVQVEWLESTEEITARDFAEFRSQTLALYQRSVRSVDSETGLGCAFPASRHGPGRPLVRSVRGRSCGRRWLRTADRRPGPDARVRWCRAVGAGRRRWRHDISFAGRNRRRLFRRELSPGAAGRRRESRGTRAQEQGQNVPGRAERRRCECRRPATHPILIGK